MEVEALDVVRLTSHWELEQAPAGLARPDVTGVHVVSDFVDAQLHLRPVVPFVGVLI